MEEERENVLQQPSLSPANLESSSSRSAHRLREIFGLFGQHSNSWGERAANKVTLSDVEFFPG